MASLVIEKLVAFLVGLLMMVGFRSLQWVTQTVLG